MNLMTSLAPASGADAQAIAQVRDILTEALKIVDTLGLPGQIGIHLDHSIQLLGRALESVQAAPWVSAG